jgi:hypothetical protein
MTQPPNTYIGKNVLVLHEQRGHLDGLLTATSNTAIRLLQNGFPEWLRLDELESIEVLPNPNRDQEVHAAVGKLETGVEIPMEERFSLLGHIAEIEAQNARYKEVDAELFPK